MEKVATTGGTVRAGDRGRGRPHRRVHEGARGPVRRRGAAFASIEPASVKARPGGQSTSSIPTSSWSEGNGLERAGGCRRSSQPCPQPARGDLGLSAGGAVRSLQDERRSCPTPGWARNAEPPPNLRTPRRLTVESHGRRGRTVASRLPLGSLFRRCASTIPVWHAMGARGTVPIRSSSWESGGWVTGYGKAGRRARDLAHDPAQPARGRPSRFPTLWFDRALTRNVPSISLGRVTAGFAVGLCSSRFRWD